MGGVMGGHDARTRMGNGLKPVVDLLRPFGAIKNNPAQLVQSGAGLFSIGRLSA